MNPTPLRSIRIPDDLWHALRDKAKAEGADASVVIRQLIAQWLQAK